MKYRLPTKDDYEILKEYVEEHYAKEIKRTEYVRFFHIYDIILIGDKL